MDRKNCMKCGRPLDGTVPMCHECKDEIKDFVALGNYLNNYKGSVEDLIWLISNEINDRQLSIIGSKGCKIEMDYANSAILYKAVEPSDGMCNKKPWLWDRYVNISETIKEIKILYQALSRIHAVCRVNNPG